MRVKNRIRLYFSWGPRREFIVFWYSHTRMLWENRYLESDQRQDDGHRLVRRQPTGHQPQDGGEGNPVEDDAAQAEKAQLVQQAGTVAKTAEEGEQSSALVDAKLPVNRPANAAKMSIVPKSDAVTDTNQTSRRLDSEMAPFWYSLYENCIRGSSS